MPDSEARKQLFQAPAHYQGVGFGYCLCTASTATTNSSSNAPLEAARISSSSCSLDVAPITALATNGFCRTNLQQSETPHRLANELRRMPYTLQPDVTHKQYITSSKCIQCTTCEYCQVSARQIMWYCNRCIYRLGSSGAVRST